MPQDSRYPMTSTSAQVARQAVVEDAAGTDATAFGAAVSGVLRDAIAATGAAFGNVQMFDERQGGLEIVAHSGFPPEFLDLFALVTPLGPSTTVCARAFRRGQRVMIADVTQDPEFAPYLEMARRCGFRAVQSTPLLVDGSVVGVLSTHFAQPTASLPAESERLLDGYAAAIVLLLRDRGEPVGAKAG